MIDTLCINSLLKNATNDDADTRKYAIRALTEVVVTVGLENLGNQLPRVVDTLFQALNDYSVDRRGDVGWWVRSDAMVCFKELVLLQQKSDHPHPFFTVTLGILSSSLRFT